MGEIEDKKMFEAAGLGAVWQLENLATKSRFERTAINPENNLLSSTAVQDYNNQEILVADQSSADNDKDCFINAKLNMYTKVPLRGVNKNMLIN